MVNDSFLQVFSGVMIYHPHGFDNLVGTMEFNQNVTKNRLDIRLYLIY